MSRKLPAGEAGEGECWEELGEASTLDRWESLSFVSGGDSEGSSPRQEMSLYVPWMSLDVQIYQQIRVYRLCMFTEILLF